MNYLDKNEVPIELLHRKVLEKLGYFIALTADGQEEYYAPNESGDIDFTYPTFIDECPPIDDNLCRKLREMLTDEQWDQYLQLVTNKLRSPDYVVYTRDLLTLSPENHLRVIMQATEIYK